MLLLDHPDARTLLNDATLSAGAVRVPSRDSWMRVPELERQSHLCVLLSAQPLDAQLRRCPDGHAGRNHPPGRPLIQFARISGRTSLAFPITRFGPFGQEAFRHE